MRGTMVEVLDFFFFIFYTIFLKSHGTNWAKKGVGTGPTVDIK